MKTTALVEPFGYPVEVYDVNVVLLGVANDKQQYINLWNNAPANASVGFLSGGGYAFSFELTKNAGPIPSQVYGNPYIPANALLNDDGNILLNDDGSPLLAD